VRSHPIPSHTPFSSTDDIITGTFTHNPLIYRHCSIPFPELTALYSVADMCIVSSIRDGLNLVSYEYIACQALKYSPPDGMPRAKKGPGILVLSQYTGAATMLPSSLQFNPWDIPRFAETIHRGLEIDAAERTQRYEEAAKVVEYWTSLHWGQSFLKTLQTMKIDEDEKPAGEGGGKNK
jgi:trehalose 6-phosphate synthase